MNEQFISGNIGILLAAFILALLLLFVFRFTAKAKASKNKEKALQEAKDIVGQCFVLLDGITSSGKNESGIKCMYKFGLVNWSIESKQAIKAGTIVRVIKADQETLQVVSTVKNIDSEAQLRRT